MCFCPWLSLLLRLEKAEELGCHTSNVGTCACRVVWRVHGGGGEPPPLPSHWEGREILRSHIHLHNIWQLITQPTPFLSSPEGSIAVTGRDLAKGSPALGFMGKKNSPECDDDVIPAEIIILVENTLNGPRQ